MKPIRSGVRPVLILAPVLLLLTVAIRWMSMSSTLAVLDVRPSRSNRNTNLDSSEPLSAEKVVLEWDPEGVLKSRSFDRESMKREIPKFLDVWNRRPLKSNRGGMGFHHQFMLWYTVRRLQPKLIVESGMKSGATTWLLRDAAPLARIISFDPVEQSDWVPSPILFLSLSLSLPPAPLPPPAASSLRSGSLSRHTCLCGRCARGAAPGGP